MPNLTACHVIDIFIESYKNPTAYPTFPMLKLKDRQENHLSGLIYKIARGHVRLWSFFQSCRNMILLPN